MQKLPVFTFLVASLALFGCSSSDSSTDGASGAAGSAAVTGPVSFKTDVVPIFKASCSGTSCHTEGKLGSSSKLVLDAASTDTIYTQLTMGTTEMAKAPKRVIPGDSKGSFLIRKLNHDYTGLDCSPSCGDNMPQGLDAPYDAVKTAKIAKWIDDGAKND